MRQLLTLSLLACVGLMSVESAAAIDLFYDFEDEGAVAVDKLIDDGAQNGMLLGNVSFDSSQPPFGRQAALFEEPDPVNAVPPFSTLEITDTTLDFDFDLTVAMHMENKESEPDFTRLFSTYQGTGAVPFDRSVFLDFDPTGNSGVTGLRAIVNSEVIMTPDIPDGLGDPGYHHYALTIEQGDVSIFFDGEEVISGVVPLGYSSDVVNIHIGEDPHDGGGGADEQLIGNFDEVLVLERALGADDIALLADGNLVSSVVQPRPNELAVYYDFEGDQGTTITDKFTADGAQNGIANLRVEVDQIGANAKLGSRSASIEHPSDGPIFSQIDVGTVGNLGDQFTLSAVVNVPSGGFPFDGLTRLFSSFRGTGPIQPEELIFDFDPNASVQEIGMRLVLPDGTQIRSDVTFSVDENHTLTAVYDEGDVFLYLDGEEVGGGLAITADEVDLGNTPLKIGEDNGGILNENFQGFMDDVLILSRALSSEDAARLADVGAASFLGIGKAGDFNQNGLLDAMDIDLLSAEVKAATGDASFDLNGDQLVDQTDRIVWIKQLKRTWIGDADLNGEFNSGDLVKIFDEGRYGTGEMAGWAEGDWNGDMLFDSGDLVDAFQDTGYDRGPLPAVAVVPEPSSCLLFLLGCATLCSVVRRR